MRRLKKPLLTTEKEAPPEHQNAPKTLLCVALLPGILTRRRLRLTVAPVSGCCWLSPPRSGVAQTAAATLTALPSFPASVGETSRERAQTGGPSSSGRPEEALVLRRAATPSTAPTVVTESIKTESTGLKIDCF